jgi:hypothetical protein
MTPSSPRASAGAASLAKRDYIAAGFRLAPSRPSFHLLAPFFERTPVCFFGLVTDDMRQARASRGRASGAGTALR